MAHFAHLDPFNVVDQVIVADADFIASLPDPENWIQTSYNTRSGVHYGQDGQPDGGLALRKNYAGIGFSYDRNRDAFIPPKPWPSWTLNEETCQWEPSIPCPADGRHIWVEEIGQWVSIPEAAS